MVVCVTAPRGNLLNNTENKTPAMHLLYVSTLHQQPIVLIAHIGTSQKNFQRRDAVVRRFLWGIAGAT